MDYLINNMEMHLQGSMFLAFLAAFAGGLLTSCTPCVYPMLPVTAALIGERNIGGSKLRGLFLSLIYVTGISVTYTALGIFAASTGSFFGEISTSPAAFFIIANLIIFLSLCMLDVFTMPTFIIGNKGRRKGDPGIFFTGIATGLVAGPCTAPVLGVLLAYVASTGDVLTGGALLFVFSIGMSFLLIIAGTFAGFLTSIPRSGEWMVKIKKFMGLVMLGLGEYFLIKAGQFFI